MSLLRKNMHKYDAGIPHDFHIWRGFSRSFPVVKNGLQVQK